MTPSQKAVIWDFIKIFGLPTLILKTGLMYFGAYMTMDPGEGYGYGFAVCALLDVLVVACFLWKYRDVQDP